ncbi:MAG: alpha-ketoglutarate-dependent dioxygenase AlkB [Streptosporangiaceae bacterium]|jgi:alkylated DNA repair dioxygenase AlkB
MSVLVQDSLLDLADEPSFDPLAPRRTALTSGAWVDVQHGWLAGSAPVFERLLSEVPWRAERRRMYDKTVDVPRLLCFYGEGDALPSPVLATARDLLNAYYQAEPLITAGMCLYRDGQDSVAWHGDTIGRGLSEDVMVAILSLGAPRPLVLRPRGGGQSVRFELGHGDLVVMGGSCQRTWEHAIPKTAHQVGPRISIQFRAHDVR